MAVISIDIGTTKICAIAVDENTGIILDSVSEKNVFIDTGNLSDKIQDAEAIFLKVEKLYNSLSVKYSDITLVSITGQMHGIVYVDRQGNAVSPLYTWQDENANSEFNNGYSYAEYLSMTSKYEMASGYGLTTYYYHLMNEMLPEEACRIVTIQDYAVMRFTGKKNPVTHISNAAGLGMFDIKKGCFDENAMKAAGLDTSFLPEVADDNMIIGETAEGVPVCVAIGDNQASFIGATHDVEECIHVNIGTGSQVSIAIAENDFDKFNEICIDSDLEIRPLDKNRYLVAGSSLCGGRAFALIEEFFRSVLDMAGIDKYESLYPAMDKLLEKADSIGNTLIVSTKFCGTRRNPSERGNIGDIGCDNLTPANLMVGVLDGIAQELYDMILPAITLKGFGNPELVSSGNGIRKNKMLSKILSDKFQIPLHTPGNPEEAAYGAALFVLRGR